jgi:ABC-type phosphate transport system auxiliary subunit
MKLEDLKSILDSLKANPMAIWGLVFASLGTIATFSYQAITKYNEVSAIVTGYDDTSSAASSANRKVDTLIERVNSQQEAIIKLQERSSDALLNAREAKIVAESTQKEARAAAQAQKTELDATTAAIKSELNSVKRATSNRLGN